MFLAGFATQNFAPLVLPKDLETEPERKRARLLMQDVQQEHHNEINDIVQTAYQKEYDANPSEVRDDPMSRHGFLVANYFDIIEKVVRNWIQDNSFIYHLEIYPESLQEPEDRKSAIDIICRVRRCHLSEIEKVVDHTFNTGLGNMASIMTQNMRADLLTAWLMQKYFAIAS